MSGIGPGGFNKFPSAKHFASWLRLAPNNKISGGKTLSNRIPKGSNRLKIALRNAANAVGNLKDSDLGRFFQRIAYKKRQAGSNNSHRPKNCNYPLEYDHKKRTIYTKNR